MPKKKRQKQSAATLEPVATCGRGDRAAARRKLLSRCEAGCPGEVSKTAGGTGAMPGGMGGKGAVARRRGAPEQGPPQGSQRCLPQKRVRLEDATTAPAHRKRRRRRDHARSIASGETAALQRTEACGRLPLTEFDWRRTGGAAPGHGELWDARRLPPEGEAALRSASSPCTHAPSASRESNLLKAADALAGRFEASCSKILGGRKWFAHFEQWLWACRSASPGTRAAVPVLPQHGAALREPELERKLSRAGAAAATCRSVGAQLARACTELAASVDRDAGTGDGVVTVEEDPQEPAMLRVTCGGAAVSCSREHWAKLKELHRRHGAAPRKRRRGTAPAQAESSFEVAAYSALARLHALQGNNPRAGGMQAAIHGGVFDALHDDFGCMAECFASPVNCRWDRFCSAAADVDGPFGSMGSFFDFRPSAGSFQANPPYDSGTVAKMTAHMEGLLRAAEERGLPLCFVVVIPRWEDKACWQELRGSTFQKAVLDLPQAEHGFCEGGQHHRLRRYRQANHDSTVFVLQSAKGALQWPASRAKLRRLAAAFRPRG